MQSGREKRSVIPDFSSGGLRVRISSGPSYLARLAAVYADPLRLKIVTELYTREMSPTQFHAAFGGGSVSKVRRHFRELAAHGWLRKVRTETHAGGGRPRYVYRATEPAVIDDETWAGLPPSMRAWLSWRTLAQFAERAEESLAAGTLDSQPDRHLTWTSILLDQRGWQEQIQAMNSCFRLLSQEQEDAKIRLKANGEEPMTAIVALAGFESPAPSTPSPGQTETDQLPADSPSRGPHIPFTTKVAKVFADPLMLRIVAELNIAPMSATQLAERIGGGSVYAFDRRCKLLVDLGWLVHVGEKTGGRRRGATEHFYRAVGPVIYDDQLWRGVRDVRRNEVSRRTLQQAFDKAIEALRAGTFDARVERHLSWWPLRLDRTGWIQVIGLLDSYFESLFPAQQAAKQRMRESGEDPIVSTFFLAAFEVAPFAEEPWSL